MTGPFFVSLLLKYIYYIFNESCLLGSVAQLVRASDCYGLPARESESREFDTHQNRYCPIFSIYYTTKKLCSRATMKNGRRKKRK